MSVLYLLASLTFAFASEAYDTYMTEKGLKAGVAIEGNSWLVGQKPSALALTLRDATIILLTGVPSAIALYYGSVFYYSGLVVPVVRGVQHIIGGREWAALLRKK